MLLVVVEAAVLEVYGVLKGVISDGGQGGAVYGLAAGEGDTRGEGGTEEGVMEGLGRHLRGHEGTVAV